MTLVQKTTVLYLSFTAINPLSASVPLCCTANQLTGFYMRATLALNGLNFKFTIKFVAYQVCEIFHIF